MSPNTPAKWNLDCIDSRLLWNLDVLIDVFQRRPVILRGLDIGACKEKWTVDYLSSKAGDKEVKIHVAPCAQMDFIHKNFAYRYVSIKKIHTRAGLFKTVLALSWR
jgi:hypothetical protein